VIILTSVSYQKEHFFDAKRFKKMTAGLKAVDFSKIEEVTQPNPDKFCDSTTCVVGQNLIEDSQAKNLDVSFGNPMFVKKD